MTGPEGAEIRYTTDGAKPTAQSSLYSSAITLSATTTVTAITTTSCMGHGPIAL